VRTAAVFAIGGLVAVIAGCSVAATPSASSPVPAPVASPWEVPVQTGTAFTLSSTAFQNGGAIPRRFTCDGENVSPDLEWRGTPEGTVEMALIVDDPDARDFTHWVVYQMTSSATGGLPEAISSSPDAPPQGLNDFGSVGYGGPCPPSGRHHYRFTLYALRKPLEVRGTPRGRDLRALIEGRASGVAVLIGTCQRG